MAALWSAKNAHPPVSRDVHARSLDGYRMTATVVVKFRRALAEDAANEVVNEVAEVTADVLGEQISQGRVPLGVEDLAEAIRKRASATANKAAELEVAALAMVGERTHRATVPSAPTSGAPAPHRAPVPSAPMSGFPASRRASVPSMPTSRVVASHRAPVPSTPTSGPPASPRQSPVPSPTSGSSPARSQTPPDDALSQRTSGSLLVAPPRTLWLVALSQCGPDTPANEIVKLLGLAFRDSTAAAMLRTLLMTDPGAVDRLALLEGCQPMPTLRTEICACLAAGFSRALMSDGWDPESALRLSERAVAQGLSSSAPPGSQVRSYLAAEAPVRDLARRAANIVGVPTDAASIHAVLSPYCEALRVQFASVANELRRLKPT